jgi:hypothetical protein
MEVAMVLRLLLSGLFSLATLAGCALPLAASAQPAIGEVQKSCPANLDAVATCSVGRDANGAYYLIAKPKTWNNILIVHAHGGPRLGDPKAEDSDEDLERFAVMVRNGYAWIGSTYRRGGYGVRMAAHDVDNSRAIFWQKYGKPRLTILHGQSYGGNVAAKLAELDALDTQGEKLYNGVLLTNAILMGGTRAYTFRSDLRAVYQYFCTNHPRASEPAYPLWSGLPRDSTMTRADLEARVNECTGVGTPDARRSPEQKRRLSAIVGATGINEQNLQRHLEWATFTFRDLVQLRLQGANPFDNMTTVYRGSGEDVALNQGVARFAADPYAVSMLAYDSDLSGIVTLPTLAINWRDDPVVSAQGAVAYESLIESQRNQHLYIRLQTEQGTHGRLADSEYMSTLTALVTWINSGSRPDPACIRATCPASALSPPK